jgi:hypothetical protein
LQFALEFSQSQSSHVFFLQLLALRSEALLRLNKLEEADSTITNLLKLDSASLSSMSTKLSGMVADSYVHVVQAQVNMAFGRYDSKTHRGTMIISLFLVQALKSVSAGLMQLLAWLRRPDLLILEMQRLDWF